MAYNKYTGAYHEMMIEERKLMENEGAASAAPAGVAGSAADYMQQFHDNPKTAVYNTPSILIPINKRKLPEYISLKEGCDNCGCEKCDMEKEAALNEKCKAHLVEFLSEVFDVEEVELEDTDMINELVMLKLTKKDGEEVADPNQDQEPVHPDEDPNQPGNPENPESVTGEPNKTTKVVINPTQ